MALFADSPYPDVPPPVPIHRFSVEEYQRLGEVGVLSEDDRVELLEGWIVPKMMRNGDHDGVIHQLMELLQKSIPDGWTVRNQGAIVTADSQPEPDLAIAIGNTKRYRHRHPAADEIAVVIEIAGTSLRQDKTLKNRIYSRAGIPSYWLINLQDLSIEFYSEPTGDAEPRYQSHRVFTLGQSIPLIIAEQVVAQISVSDAIG